MGGYLSPVAWQRSMRREPFKAFGHLAPVEMEVPRVINAVCTGWGIPPCAILERDTVYLNVEGVFFPLDDVLASLQPFLQTGSNGKIDMVDMDAWLLIRAVFNGTEIRRSSASLNDILAWATP